MENITETSVKELMYDKWIFRLEIPDTYWIKLEPIEGSLAKIEEIIARNIKRLKSLRLEDNESRALNEWIYTENTIKEIIDRILLVVEHYKELDEKEIVPEKEILEQLANGAVSIVEDGSKYYTNLTVFSYCDFDQSYELIIEFIEYFREKYKNDANFNTAMNNFITINKDTNCVGYYFSRNNYYESLPALFWIERFIKNINLDTSSVDRDLKKLEGFIKSEHDEASKIHKNSKDFFDERMYDIKQEFTKLNDNVIAAEKRLKDLEEAYKEKLKLEAPEELWNSRAADQESSIFIWGALTIVTIIGLIILLSQYLIPSIVRGLPNGNYWINPTSMMLLVTAFMIYIIKVEIKFWTSSWHLKKVYQQKAALTRFYQALIADGKEINGEERLLIMKALFGEVNTGLVSSSEKSDLDVVINSILKK
jgi:hypothetical protein